MTPRIGMLPRAITLVPLAALSAVWTVNIARTPADVSAVAGPTAARPSSTTSATAPQIPPSLPGSALVVPPDTQAPASVWGDAKPASGKAVVTPAMSTQAIPAVALAAYQRAATVIDTADRACHLDWTLLAAIGRIESDHGSHGGSQLSATGVATPAIVGPALTGLGGTMLMRDTDAGRLDGDTRFDHAVGPMQFLPSTWSVVGVDADGDGQRDPQDIDDAALAAGVYLCSGSEDLASDAGRRAALLRYNHSTSYVATVMNVATAYQSGLGLSGLGGVTATRVVSVVPAVVIQPEAESTGAKRHKRHRHHQPVASLTGPTTPSSPGTDAPGTDAPAPEDPAPTGGGHPAPVATSAQLRELCTENIVTRYPIAGMTADDVAVEATHAQAIEACITDLGGATLDQARKHLDDAYFAQLVEKFPTLVPTDPTEPTDPADPTGPTEPTGEPSTEPTTEPSGEPADDGTESPGDSPTDSSTAPSTESSTESSGSGSAG